MPNRRSFLHIAMLTVGGGVAGLLRPLAAFAADWQKNAFEARDANAVLSALGVTAPGPGKQILLDIPDIVDSGAGIPLKIMSAIPATDWIAVLVDRNPTPLAAQFNLSGSTEPEIEVNIKMAQTSMVRALVRAGGKYYAVTKEVKVAIDGCG